MVFLYIPMKCWLISQQESSHQYRNIYLSLPQNISQEIAKIPHFSQWHQFHLHFLRPPSVPATIWPSSQARRLLSHHPRNPEEVADQRRRADRLQIPSEGDFLFLTWRPWHHGTMGPGENLGKCGNSWWETPWLRWKYEVNSKKMEENDDSLWGGLAKPCESHGKIGSELMLIQFWGEWTLKETGNSLAKPTKTAECKAKKTGSELRKLGINPSSDAEFWLRK